MYSLFIHINQQQIPETGNWNTYEIFEQKVAICKGSMRVLGCLIGVMFLDGLGKVYGLIQLLFSQSSKLKKMVFVLTCQMHSLPREKVCGQEYCSLLLCDQCFKEHALTTNHSKAVCLNSHSLAYFCTFTKYLSNKMKEWSELILGQQLEALFHFPKIEGSGPESKNCLLNITVQILKNYGDLMQGNHYFVSTNSESATLYHPEFLKDLFNLVTKSWEVNSRLITQQLVEGMKMQKIVSNDKQHVEVTFGKVFMNQIQNFRIELINSQKEMVMFEVQSEINKQELMEVNTNDKSESSRKQEKLQSEDISQFQLSQSCLDIQVIESYETIQEMPQASQGQRSALKEQNSLLRIERDSLLQDNMILRNKCQQLQVARQGSSSLKKQRSSASLNNELLAELVQLQAQIVDKDYDLHILVNFLNELASSKKIDRGIFQKKLLMLRTIRIQ